MSVKYKIILNYIKDLSLEVPSADALVESRKNIYNYTLDLDISSNAMKNNMIEVNTKLIYLDKKKISKKSYFEMVYSTIIKIDENNPEKKDLKKLILCDLQIEIFPTIKKIFQEILRMSGFPKLEINKNIDFKKIYNQKIN